jgi:hypothetical protein
MARAKESAADLQDILTTDGKPVVVGMAVFVVDTGGYVKPNLPRPGKVIAIRKDTRSATVRVDADAVELPYRVTEPGQNNSPTRRIFANPAKARDAAIPAFQQAAKKAVGLANMYGAKADARERQLAISRKWKPGDTLPAEDDLD